MLAEYVCIIVSRRRRGLLLPHTGIYPHAANQQARAGLPTSSGEDSTPLAQSSLSELSLAALPVFLTKCTGQISNNALLPEVVQDLFILCDWRPENRGREIL